MDVLIYFFIRRFKKMIWIESLIFQSVHNFYIVATAQTKVLKQSIIFFIAIAKTLAIGVIICDQAYTCEFRLCRLHETLRKPINKFM